MKYIFLHLIYLIGLSFFVGCKGKPASQVVLPVLVKVAEAKQQDVPQLVTVFGKVAPINQVEIVAQVSGTLEKVHFKYGDVVQAGDVLYTIDQRSYLATVEKNFADFKAKEALAKVAQDKMNRNRPLVDQRLISPQDYENLVADADRAYQEMRMAAADLVLAEINLGYTEITAPLSGVTGEQMFSVGDYIEIGKSKLVTINQIDPIQINCFPSSKLFDQLQSALRKNQQNLPMHVSIVDRVSNFSGKKGLIQFIDNQIDSNTGSIQLQGVINNEDQQLWAGQFVNVDLELGIYKNAVLIPKSAVVIGPKGPYAFVINADETADYRLLEVAETSQPEAVILKGIQPGEKVVTLGQLKLRQGVKAKIMDESESQLKPKSS